MKRRRIQPRLFVCRTGGVEVTKGTGKGGGERIGNNGQTGRAGGIERNEKEKEKRREFFSYLFSQKCAAPKTSV